MLICAKGERNIPNKHEVLEDHRWQEVDQFTFYTAQLRF